MQTNSLVLKVQSDSVKTATGHLDTFATAANKAERATNGFEKGGKEVNQSLGKTNAALATNTASTTANTTAKSANTAASTATAGANAAASTAKATNTAANTTNTASTTANTASKAVNNGATAGGVKTTVAGTAATGGNTAATAANTVAKRGATTATIGLNGATKGLLVTVGTLVAPLLAILAPLLALNKVFSSTVELQDWQAQLKTATGTTEAASFAFGNLKRFASETPYELGQSVEAFVKLTNLGLAPSEEALRSYGNTASAMGKDLNQMIEAVADATTGEFERLKEFGIKTKSEGNKVSFTFRGVTKTVAKESKAIEGYLMALGENEFAGAMSDRMNTVGGLVSNFGDTWDELFRTISEAGVGDLIGQTIQTGIDILNQMIALMQSGAVESELKSWGQAFEGWGDLLSDVATRAVEVFGGLIGFFVEEGDKSNLGIINAFKKVPAVIKYWVERAGIEIEFIAGYATTAGIKIFKSVKSYLTQIFGVVKIVASQIGDALAAGLNPFDNRNFADTFASNMQNAVNQSFVLIQKETQKTDREVAILNKQLKVLKDERIAGIAEIGEEFANIVSNIDETDRATQNLIQSFKALQEAGPESGTFSIAPTLGLAGRVDPTAPLPEKASKKKKKGGASKSRGPSDFEKLVEDLRSEEEAIEGSYLKRLELIRRNTQAGSAIRAELTAKINAQYQEDIENFAASKISELDIARNGFSLQLEELDSFFERRKELILNNEALTELERTELLVNLHQERNDLIRDMEIERGKQGLQLLSEHFEGAATLATSSNKKLASIGRAALLAQKAIAITQATIKTYEAATSAYASLAGIPVIGPALGAAAAGAAIAGGLANVAAIASTNTSAGNFADGGIVGGSSFSGDNITANVNSGEMILNAAQQRNLFDKANGGGSGGGATNITIINQTGEEIDGEVNKNENGDIEIIIRESVKRTKAELTGEASNGGGTFVPALQSNYGLRRTGTQ